MALPTARPPAAAAPGPAAGSSPAPPTAAPWPGRHGGLTYSGRGMWENMGKSPKPMGKMWETCGKHMGKMWENVGHDLFTSMIYL